MSTNRNKLALRRSSIRILSADALRIAHGGKGNGTATANTGGAGPCGTASAEDDHKEVNCPTTDTVVYNTDS